MCLFMPLFISVLPFLFHYLFPEFCTYLFPFSPLYIIIYVYTVADTHLDFVFLINKVLEYIFMLIFNILGPGVKST